MFCKLTFNKNFFLPWPFVVKEAFRGPMLANQ
jgi:hypothetical protein